MQTRADIDVIKTIDLHGFSLENANKTIEQFINRCFEAKVSKNLEKIEKRISKSKQQLGIQEEKTKENVQALVKVYSSMKPGEAARLIEAIDEDLALKIVSGMKSKIAGQVLSQLDVKVAKRISETLAGTMKEK